MDDIGFTMGGQLRWFDWSYPPDRGVERTLFRYCRYQGLT